MHISLNWIRDFVDLPQLPPTELGQQFTLATAEVEGVITSGEYLKTITIVETLETNPHPNAEKLKLVKFKTADGEIKEVVCGAPNVRPGIKVAFAPIGTVMPNGMKLEAKPIRGIVSQGMLCSEAELGVGEDHDGIWELPSDTKVGKTLAEVLNAGSDVVFEVDNKSLTHRPDLWGHYGMAREFAAVFKTDLKNPFDADWTKSISKLYTSDRSPIVPEVKGDTSCLGYFGISLDGVTITESPDWIKERLVAAGLRPINNMVDIGNYVMLELGIPLHIFDRDTIKDGKLVIHRLEKNTNVKVLNGETVSLETGDTVISNSKEPMVIAGIIGGEDSGVTENTKNIFIETANWKAAETRRLSTRIGIRTDSSQRYEKSLDSQLLERTILRAASLVIKLCPQAKIVGKLEYAGPNLSEYKPLTIKTSLTNISKLLGKEISSEVATTIFQSLDFEVAKNGDSLNVTVPSYRATKDIEYEADLVEEIGRIIGYDKIEPTSPAGDITPVRLSPQLTLHRKTQDFFTLNARALEIQTYPLVCEDFLKRAAWPVINEELKLINPLSEEADRMRPSLIPSLLQAVSLNQKSFERFAFFEIGRSYLADSQNFSNERSQVGFVIFDRERSPFLQVLNTMERYLGFANIPAQIINPDSKNKNQVVPAEWLGNHPNESQWIKVMGKNAGAVLSIHPSVLSNYKVRGNVALGIIDITDVAETASQKKTRYSPISKFPSSVFDCTFVAGDRVPVSDLLDVVYKLKRKEILETKIAVVFQLPEDKKAVTLRLTFGDNTETLSAEKIKELEKGVIAALEKAGYPLRS